MEEGSGTGHGESKHQEASPEGEEDAQPRLVASEEGQKLDEQNKQSNDSGFKYLLRVFTYNDGRGWLLNAVAFICMTAAGTTLPLMEIVFGQFVNVFNDFVAGESSPERYRDEVGKYALYFIYLFVAKFVLTYIGNVLISVSAIRTIRRLRVDFVRQTLRQEVSFFDSSSSSLSGKITTNGNLVSNGISEKLAIIIQAIACFVTAFIVAFTVQWKLTLIIMSIVPVNIVVTLVCVVFDTMYEYQMFDIYSASGSLAEEAFSTIRTAHAFWAFPKLSRRFDNILETVRQIGRKKSLVYAILFPFEFFCIFSGYGLAFWQGMRLYADGEIAKPGTVVTVVFSVLVAAQALTQIAPQTIAISKASAAAQDLFAVIDRESALDSLSDQGDKIQDFKGHVEFRGLHFAYPSRPHVPVLSALDLQLPAGKTTALVGASGSGKSTVFGLLERWYPSLAGSINLDGRPIESLNLQWLRTNIRLVQQEPTLFSGTIFQNVVDGLTGTDMVSLPDEEKRRLVQEACEAAFAHTFIQDLPKGYETYIGERGASLSGGQKQRIVIARSIISDPKVLLLDEATSALDPNAEAIVQRALNNVARGRTMIVIAHRLSTIRDADNIVVMSKGQLVEQGTHEELVSLDGAYSKLVKAQDLGRASHNEKTEADNDDQGLVDLDLAPTSHSAPTVESAVSTEDHEGLGFLHGLYIIVKEQPSLWPQLCLATLACMLAGATYPALAILFSKTMESFQTIDVKKANFFALMFFVVALGNAVLYAIAGWISNVVAQHIMKFYRGEIFDNTLRQDMSFFDKPENNTGALVSRLASEPTSLQELLSMNLMLMLVNVFSLVSSCILAISYGWKLGLVLTFGALPVLVGSGYARIRLEARFSDDTSSRFAESSGLAAEAAMAIRTVSSLALERAVIERYDRALSGIAHHAIGSLGWKMLFYALSQSMSFLAMGLGFWYGGRLVSTHEYTASRFYVVFIAIIFSGESAAVFFQYSTSFAKAHTAMNYIFRLRKERVLFDHLQTLSSADDAEKPREGGASLTTDQITFAYPLRPNIRVLRGVNLDVKPGKMIALVGASGCGKSTIISLLERFYDVSTGEIRFDGRDIKTLDRYLYRRPIALVQQEPILYQGSIRDNIALGSETGDPADEAIVEACQQANIWTFVSSLPEGLSTPCGSQGLSLSGGQRQRIAIARALIRKPRLLLLDEATSALDTESEKLVKEALDSAAAAAGRTTVVVAHRLSTIRDADSIAVFVKGRIVEMGTHEELVDKGGVYYGMVLGQSLDREA